MFIKCCLYDIKINDIIYNIFNKENNLFNVFMQMKLLVNVFEKMMFKLYYINKT